MSPNKPQALVLFGPTASGKTGLAVGLAEALGGEVINADSRQVYQEMPIVTACPTAAEKGAVPHHLFEFLPVGERYSAGRYAAEARAALGRVAAGGRLPIVVGGTGFYLKALMSGLPVVPEVKPEVMARVEKVFAAEGVEGLGARLAEVDPEAFAAIDRANPQRLMRALGVVWSSGKKFSQFKEKNSESRVFDEFVCVALNPSAEVLRERIEWRWRGMVEGGVVDEVRALRGRHAAEAPGMQSVGVAEIGGYLDGAWDWAEAERRYFAAMNQYVKRQRTWLRNQYPAKVVWEEADVVRAVEWVKKRLAR